MTEKVWAKIFFDGRTSLAQWSVKRTVHQMDSRLIPILMTKNAIITNDLYFTEV